MSGMEMAIVALVPTIISACASIASEYRAWRKRRPDQSEKKTNLSLQKYLAGNGPAIQHEYDEDVRRVGAAFQAGDAIAREALKDQLISLQTTVIFLLRGHRDNTIHLVHPNHASLSQQSSSARKSIVSTLEQQYQRLAQAAPIEHPVATSSAITDSSQQRNSNCCGRVRRIKGALIGCRQCDWMWRRTEDKWVTKDGILLDRNAVYDQFHFQKSRPYRSGWRCFLCSDVEYWFQKDAGFQHKPWKQMLRHLKDHHYYDEVKDSIPRMTNAINI